jgi:2'-5' RNA ligase
VAENRIDASLWLRLGLGRESKLRAVITRLANRNGTHDFVPHLTVCGPRLDPTTLGAASAYARTSSLLPLRVTVEGITYAVGNPFEAVFIQIANSPELLRLREDLRRITGADELRPPHVSLFYGVGRQQTIITVDAGALEHIARECRADVDESEIVLERPAIAHPGAGGNWLRVSEWRVEDL